MNLNIVDDECVSGSFTKEESHRIYVRAKEIYVKNVPNSVGMCYCLDKAIYSIFNVEPYYIDPIKVLPDFAKLEPDTHGMYWWNPNVRTVRLNHFDDLIKITEP